MVPIEKKQSSQIGIFEDLAFCFVAFLIPASFLTALLATMLASLSTWYGADFQ